MIIDAHAHVYDVLAGYGPRGEFRPLGKGRGIWATGDVEQFFPAEYGDLGFHAETLVRLMDEGGIDHAVLLQGGNYGFHNDYTAEAARRFPTRFTAGMTVDPYAKYALKILEHLHRDYGMQILKFEVSETWGLTGYHPALRLDGPEMTPLLSYAQENDIIVVYDMGPMGTASFDPGALFRLKAAYPELTFVMTHCFFPREDGSNDQRLAWMRELASDRFFFDIANLPLKNGDFTFVRGFLAEAKAAVGADHLIWGTDVPGVLKRFSYRELTSVVTESGVFTPEELALVMGENARRVYRIKL